MPGDDTIRTKWESVRGRRVRLWTALPRGGAWADPAVRPPLFLIHGLGCSVEAWGPALRHLAARAPDRPVYAADMPGYGRSRGPRHALGMDALADWHACLMDTLGISRAHLAGNSMGCQVALALARRHPERVVGLVLVGPTLGTGSIAFSRYVAGLLADVFLETMLYNGTLLRMYCQMGTRRYLATVRKMMEDDPLAQAGSVRAPCLILRGGRDVIIPDAEARQLAARLPNGTFLEIPKTAHAVQFNAPDRFVGAALPFWERAEIASAAKVRASRAERTSDAPDVTSRQIIP